MVEISDDSVDKQQRSWGMFCHLSAFSGYLLPLGNIFAPLIIWLVKKKEMPFVDDQGKESLNFQISLSVYFIVAALLTIKALGVLVMFALAVFSMIMIIIAAVKANRAVRYRYPLTIRLIK